MQTEQRFRLLSDSEGLSLRKGKQGGQASCIDASHRELDGLWNNNSAGDDIGSFSGDTSSSGGDIGNSNGGSMESSVFCLVSCLLLVYL